MNSYCFLQADPERERVSRGEVHRHGRTNQFLSGGCERPSPKTWPGSSHHQTHSRRLAHHTPPPRQKKKKEKKEMPVRSHSVGSVRPPTLSRTEVVRAAETGYLQKGRPGIWTRTSRANSSLFFRRAFPCRSKMEEAGQCRRTALVSGGALQNPQFIVGDANRTDICQGQARLRINILTLRKAFQPRVVPTTRALTTDRGIFSLQFWQLQQMAGCGGGRPVPSVGINSSCFTLPPTAVLEETSWKSLARCMAAESLKRRQHNAWSLHGGFHRSPALQSGGKTSTGLVKGHAYSITGLEEAQAAEDQQGKFLPLPRVKARSRTYINILGGVGVSHLPLGNTCWCPPPSSPTMSRLPHQDLLREKGWSSVPRLNGLTNRGRISSRHHVQGPGEDPHQHAGGVPRPSLLPPWKYSQLHHLPAPPCGRLPIRTFSEKRLSL
ncbi:calpain-9 [Lates japonicus]|uniref:Calpain-9 n=1 Tax=Lates japonicus TaxID=270547 RepID=A0AAD3RGK6_LATJO|nr:calpain-9 [Lates japonicus]